MCASGVNTSSSSGQFCPSIAAEYRWMRSSISIRSEISCKLSIVPPSGLEAFKQTNVWCILLDLHQVRKTTESSEENNDANRSVLRPAQSAALAAIVGRVLRVEPRSGRAVRAPRNRCRVDDRAPRLRGRVPLPAAHVRG